MTKYYISPAGLDSNNGSITAPWKTIPYGFSKIQTGDELYILRGNYTLPTTTVSDKGTNYLTTKIKPLGNVQVTFSPANSTLNFANCKGIEFGGFFIINGGIVVSGVGSTNNKIIDNIIYKGYSKDINIRTGASYNIIQGNVSAYCGYGSIYIDGPATTDLDGTTLTPTTDFNSIINNITYFNGHNNIDIHNACHDTVVDGNISFGAKGVNAIYTANTGCWGTEIKNNITFGSPSGGGITNGSSSFNNIHDNIVKDAGIYFITELGSCPPPPALSAYACNITKGNVARNNYISYHKNYKVYLEGAQLSILGNNKFTNYQTGDYTIETRTEDYKVTMDGSLEDPSIGGTLYWGPTVNFPVKCNDNRVIYIRPKTPDAITTVRTSTTYYPTYSYVINYSNNLYDTAGSLHDNILICNLRLIPSQTITADVYKWLLTPSFVTIMWLHPTQTTDINIIVDHLTPGIAYNIYRDTGKLADATTLINTLVANSSGEISFIDTVSFESTYKISGDLQTKPVCAPIIAKDLHYYDETTMQRRRLWLFAAKDDDSFGNIRYITSHKWTFYKDGIIYVPTYMYGHTDSSELLIAAEFDSDGIYTVTHKITNIFNQTDEISTTVDVVNNFVDVEGYVYDVSNNPVEDATLMLDNKYVASHANGYFCFSRIPINKSLVLSANKPSLGSQQVLVNTINAVTNAGNIYLSDIPQCPIPIGQITITPL